MRLILATIYFIILSSCFSLSSGDQKEIVFPISELRYNEEVWYNQNNTDADDFLKYWNKRLTRADYDYLKRDSLILRESFVTARHNTMESWILINSDSTFTIKLCDLWFFGMPSEFSGEIQTPESAEYFTSKIHAEISSEEMIVQEDLVRITLTTEVEEWILIFKPPGG